MRHVYVVRACESTFGVFESLAEATAVADGHAYACVYKLPLNRCVSDKERRSPKPVHIGRLPV